MRFDFRRIKAKKILNYMLLKISCILKSKNSLGMPVRIVFEPASLCNLKCEICPHYKNDLIRNGTFLGFDVFKKTIDEIGNYLLSVTFAGIGEPLLNPELPKMVDYANKKGIYTQIFTNLLKLDSAKADSLVKSCLDRVIISLDCSNKQTYQQLKNFDGFQVLCEKWNMLLERKKMLNSRLPYISISFVVTKNNEFEIEQARALAKKIGCDEFFTKTVNVCNAGEDGFSLDNSRFIAKNFNRYTIFNKKDKSNIHCPWLWNSTMVYSNADIGPCCFDVKAENVFGNIKEKSFRQIWNGDKIKKFRALLKHDSDMINICKSCTVKYK